MTGHHISKESRPIGLLFVNVNLRKYSLSLQIAETAAGLDDLSCKDDLEKLRDDFRYHRFNRQNLENFYLNKQIYSALDIYKRD